MTEVKQAELLIVAVKAWQVPEAARAMKPVVGSNTTVLPLQNGVEAVSQLTDGIGSQNVIGGLCKIVSFVVGPGHIRHAGFTPSIVIGELDNRRTERIEKVKQVFEQAGVEISIATDIQVALWMKFLFIASFSGVGAMANAPAGVLRTDPKWSKQVLTAMEEIYILAHSRGINLPSDAIAIVMAGLNALPEDATSSMHRDIAAGRPSELESQNGAVVRMAREAGVEVPTHELIYRTLKPLEMVARS